MSECECRHSCENREIATCDPRDSSKPDTAKVILGDIDSNLRALFDELRKIDDAIYSPKNVGEADDSNEPKQECLLEILSRQRIFVDALWHLAVHIREGLW